MTPRDQTPTTGEMLSEVIDLATGFGIIVLPLIILAVPALILLLPLAILALPFALLILPYVVIRSLRRH